MAQAVQKTHAKHGLLLGVPEATYATALTLLPATHGFLLPNPQFETPEWLDDGARDGRSPGGMTRLQRVDATGLGYDLPFEHYFRGPGAAYSASVKSTLDAVLRLFGMSAALTTTAGAEKIVYTLISDSFESGSFENYRMKEKAPGRGAVCYSLKFAPDQYGVPKVTGNLKAIGTLPSEASVPAITYPNLAVRTPKASAIGLTLTASSQTFTGKVRSHAFELVRSVERITDQNDANGDCGGYQLGPITQARLSCVVSATTLQANPYIAAAQIDPYQLFKAATAMGLAFQYGTAQYNRIKIAASAVQFAEMPKPGGADQASGTWALEIDLMPPDDASDLNLVITTD